MDSVTQLTLGAAVGEAVGGQTAEKRGPLWGAVFGTLPDLDVLANPLLSEAQELTFHRSVSHSLLFVVLTAVAAGLALRWWYRDTDASSTRWVLLVGTVLLTHVGLDCLTTYGTQIFWPFSREPVLFGTVFVIDPLYTIPLALGLLSALRWSSSGVWRRRLNWAGLAVSSAYLLVTIGNKLHVTSVFQDALERQGIAATRVLTTPTPFNNLLWRGVAETSDGFYVGLYSALDDDPFITFEYVPKRHQLLGDVAESAAVTHFRRFSRGYFVVRRDSVGRRTVHDLRFGENDVGLTSDGQYIFSFTLVETGPERRVRLKPAQPPVRVDWDLLHRFVARIRGADGASDLSTFWPDATRP